MAKIAKPFKPTTRERAVINRRERRKDALISKTVSAMEAVMVKAVDQVIDGVGGLDTMPNPNLHQMFHVTALFYRGILEMAFLDCDETFSKKKHLAKLPSGMPKSLKGLENLFKDKRYWPKIMKRGQILTNRLQKSYVEKLRKAFARVIPDLQAGAYTPEQAKRVMMDAWDASKSRVETIFKTETTTYFAKTQDAFYAGNENIIGFLFNCERKSTSTSICRSRHGLVYRPDTKLKRDNTPALHWNCNSEFIALANTERNRKMLLDPSRDPEKRTVVPLPPGWKK